MQCILKSGFIPNNIVKFSVVVWQMFLVIILIIFVDSSALNNVFKYRKTILKLKKERFLCVILIF